MTTRLQSEELTFLFDLDNTLYPRASGLLAHLDQHINAYLRDVLSINEDEVDEVRRRYVKIYGTTLRGCQVEHNVDPLEFIAKTHDIDPTKFVGPDKDVERILRELPGIKVVFSNSPMLHVGRTLDALNLTHLFEKIYTIEFCEFEGKPNKAAYERVLADLDADPERCVMIEDTSANLVVPNQLGMTTVLVSDGSGSWPKYVDYVVQKVPDLLSIFGGGRDTLLA